ncbi:MAG: metal ABC transporter ATP-binding protein [Candidatus Odinarchaeota archaeon]|nr:metal ABC transporter ATP-binding protein [Candidatus Odinarchaeota archaeon]
MYAVEVENVTVELDNATILDNISFKIEHPSISAIIGPNGAGKTTLLRTLLGMIPTSSGNIRIMGMPLKDNLTKIRRLIGYVPQRTRISTSVPLRVRDVVLMARLSRNGPFYLPRKKDILAAKQALEYVGLLDLWDKRFTHLSGGQQQKVLIARALAVEPKILLLDEPFTGLDIPSEKAIIPLLYTLRVKKDVSILLVTHDINPLINCADKILLLRRRIIGFGSPLDVIKEDLLTQLYGTRVTVVEKEKACYVVERDRHV